MSAVFRNQVIAGHSIGASNWFGYGMAAITITLVFMNAYHLANFLVSKIATPESGLFFVWSLKIVGAGIACIEIPLAKSMVTSYRLSGFSVGTLIQGLFAMVVVAMAIVAGISSQLADADRRDTQTESYKVSASSFNNMKKSARITRDSEIRRANNISDENSRAIAKLEAQARYQNKLTRIAKQQAAHTLKKPVQMVEHGSDRHYLVIALFSVICSLGAIFCSAFSAVFINPLVAMPAFSLRAKADHDWDSDGSNFKTADHELSPLANKFNGFLSREKVPAKALPRHEKHYRSNTDSSGYSENRPQLDDSMTGAISNMESRVSVRTQNDNTPQGDKVEYSASHYEAIKQGVLSGEIKPTQRPIKSELVRLNVRFVTDAERQAKAGDILEQLRNEGIILDNPEFGQSGRVVAKYLVNTKHENRETNSMISSECPACNNRSSVSESNLKKWGGRVSCPSCRTNYRIERTT